MKGIVFSLALAIFSASARSRELPVRLYFQFQQNPPDAVMGSMQVELESIMFPVGFNFEWRSLSANRGDELSVELAVIHFNGECDTKNLQPIEGFPGPLGWTHISDNEILPFSDVNCDGVRIFLQQSLLELPVRSRATAYGRALARVLAHELYHIFAETRKHGSGLAKAAYTVDELLSRKFEFHRKERDALRAHGVTVLEKSGLASE